MKEDVATFIAQVELASGTEVSQFVKSEFDAFVECGILTSTLTVLRKRPNRNPRRESMPWAQNLITFKLICRLRAIDDGRVRDYAPELVQTGSARCFF
jgi:hypothetical protein